MSVTPALMRRWPFAPDCGGAKRTEKNRLLRFAAHTWEADLHGDGGSHNHQCITTKATLGGGKQEAGRLPPPPPLSLLRPPIPPPSSPPPPLSAPQRRAVLDHTARWWPNMCAGEQHREANNRRMLTCHRLNAIELLFPAFFFLRLVPVCSPTPPPPTWGWPHLFAHHGTRRY